MITIEMADQAWDVYFYVIIFFMNQNFKETMSTYPTPNFHFPFKL